MWQSLEAGVPFGEIAGIGDSPSLASARLQISSGRQTPVGGVAAVLVIIVSVDISVRLAQFCAKFNPNRYMLLHKHL